MSRGAAARAPTRGDEPWIARDDATYARSPRSSIAPLVAAPRRWTRCGGSRFAAERASSSRDAGRRSSCCSPTASASGASTRTVVWGYAIASYVWWIAIGSGGTLISSMLLMTRQRWRASINRFAETMTLFAVAIAGLFPILHLGRPYYLLLARALPEHDVALAAVAQRAGLGFLGDRQLSPVLDHVLVCRR